MNRRLGGAGIRRGLRGARHGSPASPVVLETLDDLLAAYSWHWFWDSEHGATTTAWIDRVASFELRSDYYGAGSLALSATSPTSKPGYTLDGSTDFADPGMANWPTPPLTPIAGLSRWRAFVVAAQDATAADHVLCWSARGGSHDSVVTPGILTTLQAEISHGGSGYTIGTEVDDGALHVFEWVASTTHAACDLLVDGVSARGAAVDTNNPGAVSSDWDFFSVFGWGADFMIGEGYFAGLIDGASMSAGDATTVRTFLADYYGVT